MEAYSSKVRDLVLDAYDEGVPTKQIAERFKVSRSWARRVKQRLRERGLRVALAQDKCGPDPVPDAGHRRQLAMAVGRSGGRHAGGTEAGPGPAGQRQHDRPGPGGPAADAQKKSVRAAEQDRPDVRRLREIRAACLPGLELAKLVFLDECGVNTAMFRRHGRCPRGERLVGAAPAGHRQNNTLLAGVRLDGVVAPMVLDGPVAGESFAGYVERSRVPELSPGDVVVMDNLPAHKGPRVAAAAVEGAGCRLVYLPPYSPDLSPIEPMWSKVKSAVRGAAARTLDALVDAVRDALLRVTPGDCEGYFEHCGYDATPT